MIRLRTDLKIKSRVVMKCDRHIRYNPEKDGLGGIKGNCPSCSDLLAVYRLQHALLAAVRDFERAAKPFETYKPPRRKKPEPTQV